MITVLLEKFGRMYSAGDIIFCEFEEGSECFLVHAGQVSIIKISEGVEKILAVLGPGDIFGEMGVLEKKPRTATALAVTDVTVLAMDLAGLQALIRAQPDFAFKMGRILSTRIVQAYRHLANLAIENPKLRVVDMLLWHMQEPSNNANAITPLSAQEIADFSGLSLTDVDRVLREFVALGRLKLRSDAVEILDVRSLKRLVSPTSR